tara:strand:- start:9420 stop:11090 length:1671 start_codon:yes stop_codon:yes gene_type:complete
MDRNTLLAFFLIALVLILTPKYLEVFAPQRFEESQTENLDLPSDKKAPKNSINKSTPLNEFSDSLKMASGPRTEESLFTIENELYTLVLSSAGGGTFKSFSFKNYFDQDSQFVNLINDSLPKNLTVDARWSNGALLNLETPWEHKGYFNGGTINRETTLDFFFKVSDGVFIRKSLTFFPDSYRVLCAIDASSVPVGVLSDEAGFGWVGGLSPTEANVEDDQVYFNAYAYLGGEQEKLKVKEGKPETKTFNGYVDWTAIRTKYFVVAILPEDPMSIRGVVISGLKNASETYQTILNFNTYKESVFELYVGPLEYTRINNLGKDLESIMDFGWAFIRPISKAILYTLTEMHAYIPNYGFILIIFSVLIKLIVYPLTKKSYQSTAAMQKIQPELATIRDKYKNNPQKLNQAQMQLYKKKGVNPLGGCLPMLIQMPLLFALFVVFRTTIELRAEPFIWWIKDLSTPDAIINLPFHIPIYGSHIAILPIFMVISMFIQQRMMSGGAMQQPQQKTMQYFMTAFFFLMFNNFPSGLNLYYTLFNVLTILQQKLVPNTDLVEKV